MINRTFKVGLILFGLLGVGLGLAQETDAGTGSDAEMNSARALLGAAREDILRDELRLSEQEAAAFWPVYARYQADMQVVRDHYAVVLTAYTQAYRGGKVSEEHANELVENYLDIQADVIAIKRKYLEDFRKALPARMAARFYQIDNKIELELEYQLSQLIPLIDPV